RVSGARPVELAAGDVDAAWDDLAGTDAPRAYRAVWRLAVAPDQAVPLLKQNLRPVAPINEKQAGRLIADLDADDFATREKATIELEGLGEPVAPLLRKAVE